jgi:hypothetical protein
MSASVDSETPIRFSMPLATRDLPSPSALNPPKGTPQSEGQDANSEAFGTGETMREHREQQETILSELPTFTPLNSDNAMGHENVTSHGKMSI